MPLWLRASGLITLLGSIIFGGRIIWEETVWTWERGPQMIGFSLAHGPGVILFVFPSLLAIWTVALLGLSIRSLIRKRQVTRLRWAAIGLAVWLLVVLGLPEGFWQRVFISRMAASPRAGDLLVYATYRGDLRAVRGFLSHGVPVDARTHSDWRTAMHGAAVKGDKRILLYLTSKGGNVNALDRFGDSPLELAVSRGNSEAVNFLVESGAKRIRGDDAKRQKAIHDQVREDIKELNRSEAADRH